MGEYDIFPHFEDELRLVLYALENGFEYRNDK